jgi:hypothetical protein
MLFWELDRSNLSPVREGVTTDWDLEVPSTTSDLTNGHKDGPLLHIH